MAGVEELTCGVIWVPIVSGVFCWLLALKIEFERILVCSKMLGYCFYLLLLSFFFITAAQSCGMKYRVNCRLSNSIWP